ncbi:MAG TPA: TonB-dependent receptor [Xanthomonadaceae bacterium]|nr:TonB-dependent receptor [Xanthomonadaceae bacterium]
MKRAACTWGVVVAAVATGGAALAQTAASDSVDQTAAEADSGAAAAQQTENQRVDAAVSPQTESVPDQAQPAGVPAGVRARDGTQETVNLAEVVVTAQRREERLQNVPVTITAFSAQEIEEARIQQIGDIVARTPGMDFDAFPPSQPRIFIRGMGASARGAGDEPSAAAFLDDIYIGRSGAFAFDVFDVERIEVLKGPQGTLYGRNVVGGAVNVITKKPEIGAFDASVSATYGNYNRVDGSGFVNLPVSDRSALRLTASRRSHDGYVRNPEIHRDVDDQETTSARLQYAAEPTDSLRVLLSIDGTRDRATGPAGHVMEPDASNPLSNFYTPNPDPDVTYGSYPGYQNRDTWGLRAEVSNDFDFGTMTVLGGYRELELGFRYDFDGGNPNPMSPGYNQINIGGGEDENSDMSSLELRLASLPSSEIDWVVGLYYYNQKVRKSDILTLDAAVVAPIPIYEEFYADATTKSYAAFGDLTVPVGEKWSVFGGLRYSYDDKTMSVNNLNSDAPLRADEFYDVDSSVHYDDWTWRAGAKYQVTSDDMLYASVARGYRSGGLNSDAGDAAAAAVPYRPEHAIQYEIGQKSAFLGGSLIWNNTLFYLDYSDMQTSQRENGRNVISNAGRAHVFGYETQLIANASNGFGASIAYAYMDATFDEFTEGGVDYSGNRISRTPKHKLTISPSYSTILPNGPWLTFAVDYRYTSKIFDDNTNQPPELRDPTHFIDARIVLENFGNGLSLSLWGKNLTDERTRVWQGGLLGSNFAQFNEPTTYGLTLSWKH